MKWSEVQVEIFMHWFGQIENIEYCQMNGDAGDAKKETNSTTRSLTIASKI